MYVSIGKMRDEESDATANDNRLDIFRQISAALERAHTQTHSRTTERSPSEDWISGTTLVGADGLIPLQKKDLRSVMQHLSGVMHGEAGDGIELVWTLCLEDRCWKPKLSQCFYLSIHRLRPRINGVPSFIAFSGASNLDPLSALCLFSFADESRSRDLHVGTPESVRLSIRVMNFSNSRERKEVSIVRVLQ